ncbi:osmotically inducible protein OsmC [Frankia sp. KB5]|uniref:OsmC-like protein n=2 Tax=Frankiaceae TaxID=74712 RepID=Q2J4I1_FRACC|nr:OsmC-like protein [Frankia casuarinae]ORT48002.1 osmotically inducible protein OsmC [Frankia sp. KB5]
MAGTRRQGGVMNGPRTKSADALARDVIRTAHGQDMIIGRLPLDGEGQGASQIILNVGCQRHDRGEEWAHLTVPEARQLAGRLLAQAAAAERDREDAVGTADSALDRGRDTAGSGDGHPGRIDVAYLAGESYAIGVRGHEMLVDQPLRHGGDDIAATPTELFVASLASCVAFYAGRYLTRHGVCRDGLRVAAEFDMATDRPARVAAVRLRIAVPASLPERRRPGLVAVASHCTVHNSLHQPPDVGIEIA